MFQLTNEIKLGRVTGDKKTCVARKSCKSIVVLTKHNFGATLMVQIVSVLV